MALLRLINALLMVYLLLISIRLILSWFRGSLYSRTWDLLVQVTDPYLAMFRGIRFLRQGLFDFTPIAAILTLVVLLDLVNALILYGRITLGLVLASIIGAVWSGIAFILLLFLIFGAIRLVMYHLRRDAYSPFTQVLDTLLQPVVGLAGRVLAGLQLGARLGPGSQLAAALLLLLLMRLVGGWGAGLLLRAFHSLPV